MKLSNAIKVSCACAALLVAAPVSAHKCECEMDRVASDVVKVIDHVAKDAGTAAKAVSEVVSEAKIDEVTKKVVSTLEDPKTVAAVLEAINPKHVKELSELLNKNAAQIEKTLKKVFVDLHKIDLKKIDESKLKEIIAALPKELSDAITAIVKKHSCDAKSACEKTAEAKTGERLPQTSSSALSMVLAGLATVAAGFGLSRKN